MANVAISRILFTIVAFLFLLKHGNANVVDREEMVLNSFLNIVDTYQADLDKSVRWKELGAALKALDQHFDAYEGRAHSEMQLIRKLNRDAYNHYHQGVSAVFNWCVATNASTDTIVDIIGSDLNEKEIGALREIIAEMICKGKSRLTEAKTGFIESIKIMGKLSQALGEMKELVRQDFAADGVYGKKRQKFVDQIASDIEPEPTVTVISSGLQIFSVLAIIVLTMAYGQVGVVLGLVGALSAAGLPFAVVQRHRKPTLEEQIKIIDVFYDTLKKAIEKATTDAENIIKDLQKDFDRLNDISGAVDAVPGVSTIAFQFCRIHSNLFSLFFLG